MTPAKRLLDLFLALFVLMLVALPFSILLIVLLLTEGRPIFYLSERMKGLDQPFTLWKLRTMRVVRGDAGVSGGDKADRITVMGRFLRQYRLDEVPQLWNVLRGDMSFVGPRPPLRTYVERFAKLYADVLQCRPGITGLATLVYHRHEARLLATCKTPEETDAVYSRRCVPRKAKLDRIYAKHRTICLDLWLIWATFRRVLS